MLESTTDQLEHPNGSLDRVLEQIKLAKTSSDVRMMFESMQAIADGCRSIRTRLELYLFEIGISPSETYDSVLGLLELSEPYMYLIDSTIDRGRMDENRRKLEERALPVQAYDESQRIIARGIHQIAELVQQKSLQNMQASS